MGEASARQRPADAERTFVVCRCGVDMEFDWPPGRESVRCLGCGARFTRPEHLPPVGPARTWNPTAFTPWARSRRFVRGHLLALLLIAAAAILLGCGLAVWLGALR